MDPNPMIINPFELHLCTNPDCGAAKDEDHVESFEEEKICFFDGKPLSECTGDVQTWQAN